VFNLGGTMATVTAFEAKTRFGELLERVSKGEEVVITRHDKPVARLVPEGVQRQDDVRRSVGGLLDLQQRIRRRTKARLTDRQVRSAIDEGRP
jgi:prevent-host-death family protein